jgi:hypothetical protein
MPVVWHAAVQSFLLRKIEQELPDKEVKLTGKQVAELVGRLRGALDQEWEKIKTELQR